MESRIKLLGHPIHPMLIVFPLGLLSTAVVFDVLYVVTGNVDLSTFAFWALVIIISIKYLGLVMKADNEGEGGILALTALVLRKSKPGHIAGLVLLGVFGTALLYGDGLITPAISVLSAVEGFEVASSAFEDLVLPIACAILALLFLVQRRGTGGIGKVFGVLFAGWLLRNVLMYFVFPKADVEVGARYAILAILRYVVVAFAVLFTLTGLIFAFTSYPAFLRGSLGPAVLVIQVADVACWWLARLDGVGPTFALAIIATGSLVAIGLFFQIMLSLFSMYGTRGKAVLVLLIALTALGFWWLWTGHIAPALEAERQGPVASG